MSQTASGLPGIQNPLPQSRGMAGCPFPGPLCLSGATQVILVTVWWSESNVSQSTHCHPPFFPAFAETKIKIVVIGDGRETGSLNLNPEESRTSGCILSGCCRRKK